MKWAADDWQTQAKVCADVLSKKFRHTLMDQDDVQSICMLRAWQLRDATPGQRWHGMQQRVMDELRKLTHAQSKSTVQVEHWTATKLGQVAA